MLVRDVKGGSLLIRVEGYENGAGAQKGADKG